jgi:hypothetical protein
MNWRHKELSEFGDSIAWLPKEDAALVYASALAKTSNDHYGLDERFWKISARWDVDHVGEEEGRTKLAALLGAEDFFVVYGEEEVFRVSSSVFISRWRDMFLPSRDDVVVIPPSEEWCLFYCHEDEFEFGKKKEPNQALATVFTEQG